MLFGFSSKDLVQPTAEERKLLDEARRRINEQNPGIKDADDESDQPGTFSWVGASIAVAILLAIAFTAWLLLRLIL